MNEQVLTYQDPILERWMNLNLERPHTFLNEEGLKVWCRPQLLAFELQCCYFEARRRAKWASETEQTQYSLETITTEAGTVKFRQMDSLMRDAFKRTYKLSAELNVPQNMMKEYQNIVRGLPADNVSEIASKSSYYQYIAQQSDEFATQKLLEG